MYDKGKVLLGIFVFLAIFTIPFWYSLTSWGVAENELDLAPATKPLIDDGKTCVESAEWMRTHHPKLLVDWRDEAVRGADRDYMSSEYGTVFDKSLTDTCLEQCHTKKSEFCDQCHTYTAVKPDCWECHNIWPLPNQEED